MKLNYIFGVNKSIVNSFTNVNKGFIVSGNGTAIKTGTPCLIFSPEEKVTMNYKMCLVPFPTNRFNKPRTLFPCINDSGIIIKEYGKTDILDRIEDIEIPTPSSIRIQEVIDKVKNNIPITACIVTNSNIIKELIKTHDALEKYFGHAYKFYANFNDRLDLDPDEVVMCYMTFINIQSCFPVFDSSHVDGMIVHTSVVYPEHTKRRDKIISSVEFTMAYSKFSNNIETVDGLSTGVSRTGIKKTQSLLNDCHKAFEEVGVGRKKQEVLKKKATTGKETAVRAISSKSIMKDKGDFATWFKREHKYEWK